MQRCTFATLIALTAALVVLAPSASAHERYTTEDGSFIIVLGEQNEPVYTYDWTNLDLIVTDNATGAPVTGVNGTLTATIIAPNGEELSMDLEPQFRSPGSYEFAEEYFLTLPGQYKVHLEGTINGTDVTGDYLLPGPRGDMKPRAFPLPLDNDLRELDDANAALKERVATLEGQLGDLQAQISQLESQLADATAGGGSGNGSGGNDADEAGTPGLAVLPILAALGAVALVRRRRVYTPDG